MTMHSFLLALAVVVGQAEAAGLRGAVRRPPVEDVPQLDDDVELQQVSFVQLEATMHEGSRAPSSPNSAAGVFHHAVQDVIDAFGARVGDVSGDVIDGASPKQKDEYEASDKREAAENLAVLEEVESLKAQNLDLEEKLALLDEDRTELEKGLAELMKNVSMAQEFAVTAKSGLFGAPQPQLQLGSFDDLDQDESAFEEKHGPHRSHVDELAASARPDASNPAVAAAVLRSVEASLQAPQPRARHMALVDAHAGLLEERTVLAQRRAELERRLTEAQAVAQPLADRVLEATYNGVSLNMGVVGQSAPECDDDPASPGCRSRAWRR